MTAVTLDEWAGRIEARAKENPNAPPAPVTAEFTQIDVTGNAAVAKVDVYRSGKHTFTDYLSLYKFPHGWKIVGKIFRPTRRPGALAPPDLAKMTPPRRGIC